MISLSWDLGPYVKKSYDHYTTHIQYMLASDFPEEAGKFTSKSFTITTR